MYAGERTGVLSGIVLIILRPVMFRPCSCLMCFSFSSVIVYNAPDLFALRADRMRVFIILGNTLISSILAGVLVCVFSNFPQYPDAVFGGAGVLLVSCGSGSAGPQSNNCARGPFCGPRDPEGSVQQDSNKLNTVIYI